MIKVELIFDVDDIPEGEHFFLSRLEQDNQDKIGAQVKWPGSAFRVCDPLDSPNLLLELVSDAVPLLASVVLLWLGKGKRIRLKTGKTLLELSNIKETSSKEIVDMVIKESQEKDN